MTCPIFGCFVFERGGMKALGFDSLVHAFDVGFRANLRLGFARQGCVGIGLQGGLPWGRRSKQKTPPSGQVKALVNSIDFIALDRGLDDLFLLVIDQLHLVFAYEYLDFDGAYALGLTIDEDFSWGACVN